MCVYSLSYLTLSCNKAFPTSSKSLISFQICALHLTHQVPSGPYLKGDTNTFSLRISYMNCSTSSALKGSATFTYQSVRFNIGCPRVFGEKEGTNHVHVLAFHNMSSQYLSESLASLNSKLPTVVVDDFFSSEPFPEVHGCRNA